MPMNKKEQAKLEEALTAAALRYTAPVERDVPKPTEGESQGFVFYGASGDSSRVEELKSGSTSHWPVGSKYSGSQGGISMYSTRLRALKALRCEAEREYARRLRNIDIQIEREENKV